MNSKSVRLLLVIGAFLAPARAQAAPTLVAIVGSAAPAGGNYSSFGIPVLNGAGQVAFLSGLIGGTSQNGIFAGVPGSLQTVGRDGTAAPAGGNYSVLDPPMLSGAGQLAFFSTLNGGSSTAGIFTGAPGSLQAAALQGSAAPAGGNYNILSTPLVLNGAGQVAFAANLSGGTSTQGIFVGAPGALQAAAVQGIAAPAGGNYSGFGNPVLNGVGQVAFLANLTGGTSTQGIFAGMPASVHAAALQGSAAPAGGIYSNFDNPVLNGTGQVAFTANLTGGPTARGLFAGAPGSLQAAALTGTAAPAGGNYSLFGSPVLNGTGQVAFFANLTGGTSTQGVFVGTPGSLQAAALQGAAAPAGGSYTNPFSNPVLNGSGQVAFTANLTGAGITAANDTALFAGLPGSLVKVVREGDVIDVDPGVGVDNRTVKAAGISFLTGSGGQDGRGLGFNDNGLLVYRLTFTDNSSGIFTSAVPEPSSLGLLVAGMLLTSTRLVRGRRRKERAHQGTSNLC